MAKLKRKKITKYCAAGERYDFIGGKAKVPGVWFRDTKHLFPQEIYITLKEFNELRG